METKKNSTKSFGILFFIVFFVIGVWPVFDSENLRLWSIILSFLFLISGLTNANFLNPLNKTWIKFGEILGKIIAPVVMFLIFFVLITPLSFVIRIFGKDLLKTRLSDETSYWIKREKDAGTMKRQF
tara:strand:- start:376 stop:756 length:381 start_codon:yes stop_codon:yes gene_type:complete